MVYCITFWFYTYIARLCVWLLLFTMTSRSEVVIKESVVDPFSLIMERQDALMDKISDLDEKLQTLQNNQKNTKDSTKDQNNCISTEGIINIMEESFINITNSAISLIENRFSSLMLESKTKFDMLDDCYAYMDNIQKDVKDILSKSCENYNSNTVNNVSDPDPVQFYDTNHLLRNSSDDFATQYPTTPQFFKEVTYDLARDIEKAINKESKITNMSLHKMDTSLRRIEYRQQVNNIARDRTLEIILRRMALHQTIIEDRITHSFGEGIQVLKDELRRQEDAMKDLTAKERYLMNTLVDIATEMEVSEGIQKQPVKKSERKRGRHTSFSIEEEENQEDKWFVVANDTEYEGGNDFIEEEEEGDLESSDLALGVDSSATKRSVISVLNSLRHFLEVDNPDSEEHEDHKDDFVRRRTPTASRNNNIEEQNVTLYAPYEENCTPGVFNLSEYAQKYLYELEESTLKAVKKVDEKVSGLHIYQSSALHSHLREIRIEIEKMERRMSEIVQKVGNKVSTKVEITRKSLFTFIDAAVTSISSAAVTSSQSTGIQIAKTLKNVLKLAFNEFQGNVWDDLISCPGMFQKVGSKCLLILDSIFIPWKQSCQLCSSIGGEIAILTSQEQKILKMLPTTSTPGLWIRIPGDETIDTSCQDVDNEREEIVNTIDVSEDSTEGRVRTEECRALLDGGATVGLSPCNLGFGVICQYGGRGQGGRYALGNSTLSRMAVELESLTKKAKYFKH